ncbi:MAG: glycosyltransferase family 4 protein [Spirochaetes bacterium]|nr:glycosyltransferase family 4 protein [Spirochaetota bacterium]
MTEEDPTGKKVLFFSHASDLSGAPIALVRLAGLLPGHGYRPLVLLPCPGPLEAVLKKRKTAYRILRKPFSVLDFLSILKKKRPDIVHVNSLVKSWPVLAARLLRVPVVWHVHEYLGQKKLYAGIIHAVSDGVILISNEQYSLFTGKPKAVRIPNGIETDCYGRRESVPKKKGPFREKDETVVLYIGRIEQNKGLIVLARAAALLRGRSIRYLVAGGVPGGASRYMAEVSFYLTRHGLEDSFSFLGYRQDIPDILSGADILCHPSYSDTFPLVVLEAMAAGLPVVGTSVGEVPFMVENARTGFVLEPGDHEALARRLWQLASDPDLRRRMGAEAQVRVKELFDIRVHAARMAAFYDTVIQKKECARRRGGFRRGLRP